MSPSALVVRRHIYRTAANGSTFRYAFTIHDNSTASALDTTADSALGAELPSQSASDVTYAQFTVAADANNYYRISQNGNRLVCERSLAGVAASLCTPAYDPVAHRFVRIRHAAGSAIYEVSPTGEVGSWTALTSVAWDEARVPLAGVWFELKAGTNGSATAPGSVYFDNFESGSGAGNPRPVIAISSPAQGSTHATGAAITLTATASDADGIARVELFADAQSLGRIMSPPYSTTWSTATNGGHRLVAVATDTRGATASAGIDIIVQPTGCSTLMAPTISPGAGSYTGSVTVSLSSATSGAIIRYTTDGSDPSASSTQYAQTIVLSAGTTTVRARTFLNLCSPSALTQATYQIAPANSCTTAPVMPAMSPAPGSFTGGVNVSLFTPTSGGVIRYTVDGSDPVATSPQYSQPVAISSTTTLRARTFLAGCSPSAAAQGTYTITPSNNCSSVVTPAISPSAGTYSRSVAVTLTTGTPGGSIRYTTDGSDPGAGSPLYTQPIVLAAPTTTTVRARTFLGSCAASGLAQASYQVVPAQVTTTPTVSPAPGVYAVDTSITMAVADPFAIIRYTTDGSEPGEFSQQYVGVPIRLSAPLTLKARAFRPDHDASAAVGGLYTPRLPKPTIGPPSGPFAQPPNVNIAPDPSIPSVVLRYTLDGTDVTSTSPLYFGVFAIGFDTLVRARAFRDGWAESEEETAIFWSQTPVVSPAVVTSQQSTTGVNRIGEPVVVSVSGAQLTGFETDVDVYRNGQAARVTGVGHTTISLGFETLIEGRNTIAINALDSAGRPIESLFTIWAGSNALRVRAQDVSGEVNPSALTIAVTLDDDPDVTILATNDGLGGRLFSNIPRNHNLTLTVSGEGYVTRRMPLVSSWSGTQLQWVLLDIDNNDFSWGFDGWATSSTNSLNFGVEPHSEASVPLAPCPQCVPRASGSPTATLSAEGSAGTRATMATAAAAAAAADNYDMLVDTMNAFGTQRASRSFRIEDGTTRVTLRYRFQTGELTLRNWRNDSYDVRLTKSGGAFSADRQFISTVLPTLDQNFATPWRTISLAVSAGDTVFVDVSVTNDVDAAGPSWVIADLVQQDTVQISEFTLNEYASARDFAQNKRGPLLFLSTSNVPQVFGGQIRVDGVMAITGPSTQTVTSVELEVMPVGGGDTVLARGRLSARAAALLLGPFGSDGRVAAPYGLLFEINSSQFPAGAQPEADLRLRAKVQTNTGRIVYRELGRTVKRLTYTAITTDARRYGKPPARDLDICEGSQYPCGGDAWARPSMHAFTESPQVSTYRWNDFSNMNAGYFPPHSSHVNGLDVDVRFQDEKAYELQPDKSVQQLIDLLRSPLGSRIEWIWVTPTRALIDKLAKEPPLSDGRALWRTGNGIGPNRGVIRQWPAHVEHFHIRLKEP